MRRPLKKAWPIAGLSLLLGQLLRSCGDRVHTLKKVVDNIKGRIQLTQRVWFYVMGSSIAKDSETVKDCRTVLGNEPFLNHGINPLLKVSSLGITFLADRFEHRSNSNTS